MTRAEWRWVAICTAVVVVLLGCPVLWGWLAPPDNWQLYRAWAYGGDYTQYRSAMAQGYNGAWLIVNRFTPEPHNPILQYPLYAFLGHIARWLRLPLEVPYVVTSLVAMAALACALYDFFAAFLPDARDRRLAFLLVFSVGPAWLVTIASAALPTATFLNRYANAFNRPEVNTFLLFAAAPHLPLALAVLLFLLATLYRQQRDDVPFPVVRLVLRYIFPTLLLGVLNPFSLPTLLVPLGIWWSVRCVRARRILWKDAMPIAAMGMAALPLAVYNFLSFTQDPFWGQAYGSQNYQISFPLDVVLMGYGVSGVLAVIGAACAWRDRTDTQTGARGRARMLSMWIVIVMAMSYLPVNYQRRFSLGLSPVLAVLAVAGWHWVAQQRFVRPWRRWMITRVTGSTLLILLLWGQNIMFYAAYLTSHLGTGATPYAVFQPTALAEAAAYLDGRGEQVVVLTCEALGNHLAGEIRGRVVLGHAGATLDVSQRRREVADFFDNALSPAEHVALLERYGVTHILIFEGASLPCGQAYVPAASWPQVFLAEDIRVYRVP